MPEDIPVGSDAVGQIQVLELEVDKAGTIVRAAYHEGSPWSGVDAVGRSLSEVVTLDGGPSRYRGRGSFIDGTCVEYRTIDIGEFRKVALTAEGTGDRPLNRLGSFATITRATEIIDQIDRLTFGFGIAVCEPSALFASAASWDQASREIALRLIGQLRDPMAIVSWLGDAVAFAVPSSKIALLETAAIRAAEAVASVEGSGRVWQVEVVCATPPYSARDVFDLLYEQAAIALGQRASVANEAA